MPSEIGNIALSKRDVQSSSVLLLFKSEFIHSIKNVISYCLILLPLKSGFVFSIKDVVSAINEQLEELKFESEDLYADDIMEEEKDDETADR